MIFGDRMRTPLHVLPHVLLQLALTLAFLSQCTPSDVARTDAARTVEIVLDIHMCSAQPFLDRYVEQYGSVCSNKKDDAFWVVELWDGSVISSKMFLDRIASDKRLFGKGGWHPNEDFTRMEFVPLRHGVLGKQAVTKSLKLRHPTVLECAVHKILLDSDDPMFQINPGSATETVSDFGKSALHKIMPRKGIGLFSFDMRQETVDSFTDRISAASAWVRSSANTRIAVSRRSPPIRSSAS